jgi:hypothetical protein
VDRKSAWISIGCDFLRIVRRKSARPRWVPGYLMLLIKIDFDELDGTDDQWLVF